LLLSVTVLLFGAIKATNSLKGTKKIKQQTAKAI
jgi:hypothetical protein